MGFSQSNTAWKWQRWDLNTYLFDLTATSLCLCAIYHLKVYVKYHNTKTHTKSYSHLEEPYHFCLWEIWKEVKSECILRNQWDHKRIIAKMAVSMYWNLIVSGTLYLLPYLIIRKKILRDVLLYYFPLSR